MGAVNSALRTDSGEVQLSVLGRAVKDGLPGLISDIRRLPQPQVPEYSGVKASYEKSAISYLSDRCDIANETTVFISVTKRWGLT